MSKNNTKKSPKSSERKQSKNNTKGKSKKVKVVPVKSKKMKVVHLKTQSKLIKIRSKRGAVRVGSTKNPSSRSSNYATNGYRGTMFVAPTKNMMRSEDRFLKNSYARHNVHGFSNASEDKGFVYVIKGQRRN